MRDLKPGMIEVYVFRRRGERVELLCLRRARGRSLPGVWQPVTGKLRRGEPPLRGAAREVREETGLEPRRWWALEDALLYFDAAAGRARVLAIFAAEVGSRETPRLSKEHSEAAFLSARAAGARFLWEAQRRALAAVGRQILRGGPLARALEVTPSIERPPSRAPKLGR